MALSAQDRSRLERLPSLVKPLLTLVSVPHPAVATLTYVYGVVLRILQLGTEVDAAVERERIAGNAELRTAGLFRVPLAVDFQELQLASFVGLGRRRYPRALEQLEDDARVLDDSGHPDRKGARERLAIARSVIPRVYDHYERTGELRHPDFPLLSLDHLQLLNPGEQKPYRALVANLHLEQTTLFDGDLASAELLRDRLPAYVEAQLRVERRHLDVAKQQALDETIDIVRELYGSFFFGDAPGRGEFGDAVGFIVDRAVEAFGEQRSQLQAAREQLMALPAGQRDDGRLADIVKRDAELSDLIRNLRGGRP